MLMNNFYPFFFYKNKYQLKGINAPNFSNKLYVGEVLKTFTTCQHIFYVYNKTLASIGTFFTSNSGHVSSIQ